MKVILTQSIPKIGKKNQIIDAKDGFAMNYLFPKKLAIPATAEAIARTEKARADEVLKSEEIKENAQKIKSQIDGQTYNLEAKISDKGHLYGSIGEKEIVDLLKDQAKIELDKSSVEMDHIKEAGDYGVTIKLDANVAAKINVRVEGKA